MTNRVKIALAATLALSGCMGGGGSNEPPSAQDIRTLTGSQPPAETVADQSARAAGVIPRMDSLIVSTFYGETNLPELPTFRITPSCSGTSCSLRESRIGISDTVDLSDLEYDSTSSKAILSKHGITMFESEQQAENDSVYGRTYGSLMDHSAFEVGNARAVTDEVTLWLRGATAAGDLTNSRPGAAATWRGIMVGAPTDASGHNNFLQGDALLTYDFSGLGSLDAEFTDIRNIDQNRDHSVTSVRFDNVPVISDGTFEAGITGNRIQGGLYGPDHAETAGVFEQSGIVGAFGAKRDE